ncbi:uncharacterized protein LOC121371234 [Gigantopelta aegis]|uniref:uncharacterized protein LOC121371234 n=1 Tax=Gigantopelta aegis TaxID=1735272 RepID=UPI001B887E32|nr:uncharacterized protein LOC121371234 [Gigantopelta aegis]
MLMKDDVLDDTTEASATSSTSANGNSGLDDLDQLAQQVATDTKNQRFVKVDEEHLKKIIGDSLSKATGRNTIWGVKILKQWLEVRGFSTDFETLDATTLNERLRLFYAEVRNTQGELYSKSTFVGLRAAIHRHIRAPPFERNLNILKDSEFHTSNNIFLSMIRNLKKEGLDETKHHPAISAIELDKIRNSFNLDSPLDLVKKVWFDITLGFARRGSENQRELSSNSFKISSDEDGYEFIEMTHCEITKNHRGDLKDAVEPKKRIYSTNSVYCPVSSFKIYKSKMNQNNPSFYQQPKQSVSESDSVWYTSRPIGKNIIASFVKEICKAANIEKVYTNHCLRATAVTLLSHAGLENREICKITGHRTDESLKSYSLESSSVQKRAYSQILQGERGVLTPYGNRPNPNRNVHNFQFDRAAENVTCGLFNMQNSTVTINNYFQ